MKTKNFGGAFVFVCIFVLGACGSDGGDDEKMVKITSALRCAIAEPVVPTALPVPPSVFDNCGAEQITENNYQTDQSVIHLAGISFRTEPHPCAGGPFVPCLPMLPTGYGVGWENLDTGDAASGSRQYISIVDLRVGWNTYKVLPAYAQVYATGIPLQIGTNKIRVTARDSDSSGSVEITVNRVIDVTPPVVHSVAPESGGTYGSRIVVYFSEQIDPASIVSSLTVLDDNTQPVIGTSSYDPLKLKLEWQPQSTLSPGRIYTAQISNVMDLAPNVMIGTYAWSFSTPP